MFKRASVFGTECIITTHSNHNDQIRMCKFETKCLIGLFHAME